MHVSFQSGTHYGYKFDSLGNVIEAKSGKFTKSSGATAEDAISEVPNREGLWLSIVNGVYAGFKVQMSAATVSPAARLPDIVVEPDPEPEPDPDQPAFMTRPQSGTISRSGGAVVIEDVSINGGSRDSVSGIGITVQNATSVTIRNVDLANLIGGIYLYNCTGQLLIEGVRGRNIGNNTIGSGKSNYIQLAECRMRGAIRHNKFLGGWTEDMISTWHSGGEGIGAELFIEENALQGLVSDTDDARAWNRSSGTGIILSDGAGSSKNGNIICRRNTLLTPGQVGLQHIDGPNIQTYENVIYGERRPKNNNPMTSWEGNPRGVVRDNRYRWINEDGSEPSPWFSGYGSLQVTNNIRDTSLDPESLRVTL